jgi:DNA-binding MarR family transcriptional regulator
MRHKRVRCAAGERFVRNRTYDLPVPPRRHGPTRSRPTGPVADRAQDSVDRILAEWAAERPDLPVGPTAVITRLGRVRTHLDARMAEVFERFDLSGADFAMLAALRRAGPPFTLPQSELMTRLSLTSGTVSVRLTRLEARGVVERAPGTRRGVEVTLTEVGRELFDHVAPEHLARQDVLLAALSGAERDELATLLRKLLFSFEQETITSPLGMVVCSAHRTRLARRTVGLSDRAGLLVDSVEPGGAAAAAGIQPGDVLLEVHDRPLVSGVDLAEAIDHASVTGLRFAVLRGERRRTVVVGS